MLRDAGGQSPKFDPKISLVPLRLVGSNVIIYAQRLLHVVRCLFLGFCQRNILAHPLCSWFYPAGSKNGYKYIVVSRKRKRDFDEEKAILIRDILGQRVKVQKVIVEEAGEVELYCHSQFREKKELAMQNSFSEKYEAALNNLRSKLTGWNEETLWRTYAMLIDLESVFRSLKTELGLRLIYHRK